MDVVEISLSAISWVGRPSVDSAVWFVYDIATLSANLGSLGSLTGSVYAADLGECNVGLAQGTSLPPCIATTRLSMNTTNVSCRYAYLDAMKLMAKPSRTPTER